MTVIEQIKSNEVYKQVIEDAFGGIMYNVANRTKYDTKELVELWNSATVQEKESAGGIMQGAFNFLMEDK